MFPDNPDDPAATGVNNLRASLVRVLQFRRPDAMAVQKYDIRRPDSEGGGFEVRYWAPLNAPVLNEAGEVTWIIHRVEDVTEIVRLQEKADARIEHVRNQQDVIEQLQKTTSFLDAVIDNLPGMLFVKSFPDSRFVLFNRAGEELLGYAKTDYLGKSDYDFFPREQADHFVAKDRAVLDSGRIQVTPEEPISTRDKGQRLLRTIKVPVKDKDGKPEYLLGYSEDITERKAIEQQLRQAVKMEAVGQLTGGVAHDFNNLLGIIIGNLDIAAEQAASDPALREIIQEALSGALRGAELTRRLLAFSRKQPLQPAVIDLNQGLPQIAGMLRRTLGEQVTVELHPDPAPVAGQGRSRAAGRGHPQPRDQRARCHAQGRHRQHRDPQRPPRPRLCRRQSRSDARRVRPARGQRHRRRHERGGDRALLRAVLHHQGDREGHRARPQHGLRLRQAVGRPYQDLQRGRPRHDGEDLSAAQRRRRHRPRCGRTPPAMRRRPAPSWC